MSFVGGYTSVNLDHLKGLENVNLKAVIYRTL